MYKALIIDDEKPVRIAISKLGHWNYYHIAPPEMTSNGREALSAMREIRPDVVFVDMNMPVMDGGTFLEKASVEFPDSQFIVVSGYDDFTYAQRAIHYGAVDYLLKPIREEELNHAIEKALLRINPSETFGQETGREGASPEEIVEIIKEYIDSNYCTNIKITMFAEKYFFSIEYLTKLFKSRYGYSIYEYVLKLRMERAGELLANEENKIIDIAGRLGYADNHYFSKAFRNYYGVSPSQYRKKCLEEKENTGGDII
ncbi:MAG: AraC family transcriptional regulator [Roseburia sp.]|nr:AraC family transcriptional regulator [Ruminococcus sp.]MCM1155260.1 AraC family transcriptional regulator [Roseburia sp.]MCM1241230.1 AraC family transcriptional regulator [Roseburia sp.]